MTRRYERGSVVGFVLIGILLTTALVGGVWFARHPIGSTSQTPSNSDSNTTDTGSTSQNKDTTSGTADNAKATTDEELKETLAQQAAKSAQQKSASSSTSTSTTTASSKLPTTGPADTLFEIIGAAMLSGVTVAYIRSRSVA